MKRITDKELIDAYRQTKNVWEVGRLLGLAGQTVHKKLTKLGIKMEGGGKKWTEEEAVLLKALYEKGFKKGDGQLDNLVSKTGRTKSFLCKKAKKTLSCYG